MRPRLAALVAPVLMVACTGGISPPSSSSTTTTSATSTTTVPEALSSVAAPIRHPAANGSIYFVMTDRFDNGDPTNDTGGVEGGPLEHGFFPPDTGFYHGGDLRGLTDRLPYIAGMGFTAIWITPPFTNRAVQGAGEIENSSAGYHGYWQIDWTRIDPHLGTEADMQAFLATARALGIDVYFDVVVNHTGDVITYREGTYAYRSTGASPYLAADGSPFDPAEVAGTDAFPALDAAVSFPYTPVFATPEDATVKQPAWLNDPTMYHNRGNSTFVDESSLYGDFFGLDDLFTEHPAVVENLTALAVDIISRYDVAGFRLDTVKHVNDEFWQAWAQAVLEAAEEQGRPDFFLFGEVFSSDPILSSRYTTALGLPSLLDFIVNDGLDQYVADEAPAAVLAQAFDKDDWFTDADSNASMQVTFFGNHDMGRMGWMIATAKPGSRAQVLLDKMLLGFDLLFLVRGVPVVFYGDEQGMIGVGGDKSARQPMFGAEAVEYLGQPTIGSEALVGDDLFDDTHPLYRRIAELNRLRAGHPALVTGAQIVHEPDGPIFSFSRVDRTERIEYLIVANNGPLEIPAAVRALSADTDFDVVFGGEGSLHSDTDGSLRVEVPARSAVVLAATTPLTIPEAPPTLRVTRPDPGQEIPTARYRIEAELGDRRYAEVTFAMSIDGGEPIVLGTDDAPPYRLYWDNGPLPQGAEVELIVTVDDGSGRPVSERVTVTLGPRT